MTRLEGAPEDLALRLPRERRVYEFLDGLHMPYSRIDHDPAGTMELCAAIEGTLGAPICKNLLLCNRQCTAFYLLLMPGDKNFRTSELSKKIGSSRLSFGAPEYMERFLDTAPGSLSVLGLMNDREGAVRLLIDEDVLKGPYVGCHPCVNTSTLRLSTQDLVRTVLPALGHEPTYVSL